MLQLISALGLLAMIGLAWLMSSARGRVNWRLVAIGLVLQLGVAAVLFNSQSWQFARNLPVDGFADLQTWVDQGKVSAQEADAYLRQLDWGGRAPLAFAELRESFERGDIIESVISFDGTPLSVPRFPHGVLFYVVEQSFKAINAYVAQGAQFIFRLHPSPGDAHDPLLLLKSFAFGVLPTIIFFASLMSILYYIGVMRVVVEAMAWVMQRLMGTSGAESLAAAANVLIGQTEAPLVIKPYISQMTRSELNALMVGGFSTISGSLMAIFVTQGISAGHLLSASIISAPAALVIAKILQPELEQPKTLGSVKQRYESDAVNVLDAAAQGATDGMRLALNVTAMLIAFLALLHLLDSLLWLGGEGMQTIVNLFLADDEMVDWHWSLNGLLGFLFYPLAWLMGIESRDCGLAGQLLGTKMVANEFVAYMDLANVLDQMQTAGDHATVRLSERSQTLLTYALCGFSNFASVGIQIGGIGALAPERRGELAQLGLRAMLGGMLACCMTACIAGILDGVLH